MNSAYLDSFLVAFLRLFEVLDDMIKVLLILSFLCRDPLLEVADPRVGGHTGFQTAKWHGKSNEAKMISTMAL